MVILQGVPNIGATVQLFFLCIAIHNKIGTHIHAYIHHAEMHLSRGMQSIYIVSMTYFLLFCTQPSDPVATIQCYTRRATSISLKQWTVLFCATTDRHVTCYDHQHSCSQMEARKAPGSCVLVDVLCICHIEHSLRTSHTL